MNRKVKILSLCCVLLTSVVFSSCKKKVEDYSKYAVKRTDYTSVYDKIGSKITVDMVEEDENGNAFVTYEGKKYELGMDFLSMAMVYNMDVTDKTNAKYVNGGEVDKTAVYNEWWKLYIQRWNRLVPEVPLYANQYFDIYNSKISGMHTTPYYSPSDAVLQETSTDNSVILGSTTDLSGLFRNSSFGKNSPGASDLDVQNLVNGYATVVANEYGAYVWSDTEENNVVKEHSEVMNEDGTLTVTIEINPGLQFSDGSPITAKNYVASIISGSTPVYAQASGSAMSGLNYVGYKEFNAYGGEDKNGAKKEFSGIRLYSENEYKFSVSIIEDYANYYYSIAYSAFSPQPLKLYLGDGADLKDDGKGVYITGNYYDKVSTGPVSGYATADVIKGYMTDTDANKVPYSGPYKVKSWNKETLTAVLEINGKYEGDNRTAIRTRNGDGTVTSLQKSGARIGKLSYVKIVPTTQNEQLKTGQVDVLAGITGGEETNAALKLVQESNGKFAYNVYDRAGYGKLAFRCDFGPTQFEEVRQAVMYMINRTNFANTFTGGYGTVVDGPYYTGMDSYMSCADTIKLNKYAYSTDKAIETLEKGGWVYGVDGKEYVSGVRYKKLKGYELSTANLTFKSKDGKYKTVKVGDDFYMPLVINWIATPADENPVTELLGTSWANSQNVKTLGMYITSSEADFTTAIYGEYCQMTDYGYNGTPLYNATNFATGFTSSIYDQSYYWTINQDYYADYSNNYLMDEADFWMNY